MKLKILSPPSRVLPKNVRGDTKVPEKGSAELQADSGVLTTRLQFLINSAIETSNNGLNSIENTPSELVVALAITFPEPVPPHCNCTEASGYISNL